MEMILFTLNSIRLKNSFDGSFRNKSDTRVNDTAFIALLNELLEITLFTFPLQPHKIPQLGIPRY